MGFSMPREMEVCGYQGSSVHNYMMGTNTVEPTSPIFRRFTGLGVALQKAAESSSEGILEVVSAGCSFGSEIDTILGLAYRNIPDRRLRVLGIDENANVLHAAGTGLYHLYGNTDNQRRHYAEVGQDFDAEMSAHGLEVLSFYDRGPTMLDAKRLRQASDVELARSDLSEQAPITRLANLITCHNVIYHQQPEKADAIAINLAGCLAVGGIISFGASTNLNTLMGFTSDCTYDDWQNDMHDSFTDMGLEPIGSENDYLFAYQRVG